MGSRHPGLRPNTPGAPPHQRAPAAPPPASPRPPGRSRKAAPWGESGRRGRGGACFSSAPEAPPPARPRQSPAPHLRGGAAPPSAASGASPRRRVRAGAEAASDPRRPALPAAPPWLPGTATPDPRPPTPPGGPAGEAVAAGPALHARVVLPLLPGRAFQVTPAGGAGGRGWGRAGSRAGGRRLPAASLCPQPRSPGHGHARNPRAGCRRRSAAKVQGRVATRPLRMVLFPHKTPNKLSSWARAAGTKFSGYDLAPRPGCSRGRGSRRPRLGGQDGRRGASGVRVSPGVSLGPAPRLHGPKPRDGHGKRSGVLQLDGAMEVPELG